MNALAQQVSDYIDSPECLIDKAIRFAQDNGYALGHEDGVKRSGNRWIATGDPLCPLSALVLMKQPPTELSHKAAVCAALGQPWWWVKAWLDGFDGNEYTVGDVDAYNLGKIHALDCA